MFFQNRAFLRLISDKGRFYSSSASLLAKSKPSREVRQKLATDYNNRRAAYKKTVGQLRKQYADEVNQQRLADQKAEEEMRVKNTRQRLERQRVKNVQSVKNALGAEEARLKRADEFNEELKSAQINREARAERFEKARRLVLQELEEEAVHWMSTPEEVDAAFEGTAVEQTLWGRPGGFVGTPMPTEDADFWRFEGHTWDMDRRYTTPRDKLLDELLEDAYLDANLKESFWTDDRVNYQEELEDKAKLRALIRLKGRKALLLKQRQMMQDIHTRNQAVGADGMPAPPKPMKPPSLDVLADYDAMEEEGVKLLEEDPTNFFLFDSSRVGEDGEIENQSEQSMGKPVRLLDPVRDSTPSGTPFPELLGRLPKADNRTQKEKKAEEREERMWAAAQAEVEEDVEAAADDDIPTNYDPIDYNILGNTTDDDDLEWEEGLDQISDADLLNTPSHERLSESDIEYLVQKLEVKIAGLQDIVRREEGSEREKAALADGNNAVDEETIAASAEGGLESETNDELEFNIDIDELTAQNDLSIFETLSEEQIAAMISLGDDDSKPTTAEEIRDSLGKVPGLTSDQVDSIVQLELSLLQQTSDETKK